MAPTVGRLVMVKVSRGENVRLSAGQEQMLENFREKSKLETGR